MTKIKVCLRRVLPAIEMNSEQMALHAIKTIPYGANKKPTPPKPTAAKLPLEATLSATDLYTLLNEIVLSNENPSDKVKFQITKGSISDDIKKNCSSGNLIWISLDPSKKTRLHNRVSFTVEIGSVKYKLDGAVLTQFSNNIVSEYFVQVSPIDDWTRFIMEDLKYIKRQAGGAEDHLNHKRDRNEDEVDQKETSALQVIEKPVKVAKVIKRRSPVDPADPEIALAVFDKLYGPGPVIPEIKLQIVGDGIRDKLRVGADKKVNHVFWLALDYKGIQKYNEDVVTFKAELDGKILAKFKAFITPNSTNVRRHGHLLMTMCCQPPGQYSTFDIGQLKDIRPGVESRQERQSPLEEEIEVNLGSEDDGNLQPMDEGEQDFGLAALIKETISTGVKKLKADFRQQQDSAIETEKQKVKELEMAFQHRQEMVALETQALNNEIEGLKLQVSVAKNEAKQIETRCALLAKTVPDKALVVDPQLPQLQHKYDEALLEITRLNGEISKNEAQYNSRGIELFQARQSIDRINKEKMTLLADFSRAVREISDFERKVSDLNGILNSKVNELATVMAHRDTMKQTIERLEADNAALTEQLRHQPPPEIIATPPVIDHREALAHYIQEYQERLYTEAKIQLKDQLAAEAYLQVIRNDPNVLNMLREDLPDVIAKWDAANNTFSGSFTSP